MAEKWTAKLAGRDARLDTTDAIVAGPWVFVEVFPLSGSSVIDWRFYACALVGTGRQTNPKWAPEAGWFRLRADIGKAPSARLTEEAPSGRLSRPRR